MPTYSAAMQAIQARIATSLSSYFVLYDNDGNDKNIPQANEDTVWIRATFRLGEAVQVEKGATTNHRQSGLLIFQVFSAVGVGLAKSDEAVNAIVAAFREADVSGVIFRAATPRPVGRDGALFQTNVECAFYFDSK